MSNVENVFHQVPVVILCGGKGILLEKNGFIRVNKGLIEVNDKPLFWWCMYHYALHGATEFVLATGYQGEEFGGKLHAMGAEVIGGDLNCYQLSIADAICRVRMVSTASNATTGERLLSCKPLLTQSDCFALTYSDTLSDVDLTSVMKFHKQQELVATLVASEYPVRFRILGMRQGEVIVRAFAQRPVIDTAPVNGGYYIFSNAIWGDEYAITQSVALESQPLESLAKLGQLAAFEHKGFWQHCDSEREIDKLSELTKQLELR